MEKNTWIGVDENTVDIAIATPGFFWLALAWYMISHPLLLTSLCLQKSAFL